MGQLEFDLRLDYERSLKDNLIAVTKFAGEQMKQNLEDEGRPLKAVESKQEAYGIAAQQFVKVCTKEKALKGQMDDFLKLLDADGEATQVAGTIYNAAMELAQESILMAAQASRILVTEPILNRGDHITTKYRLNSIAACYKVTQFTWDDREMYQEAADEAGQDAAQDVLQPGA